MSSSFRLTAIGLFLGATLSAGCSTPSLVGEQQRAALLKSGSAAPAAPAKPRIEVIFREGKAYAREDAREWLISEVGQKQMLWAPNGVHFAYLKEQQAAKAPRAGRQALALPLFHLVIRNIRGDPVNEFPVYRNGEPRDLDWIDNGRLAYLAPPDKTGDVYVIHEASSGEILQVLRGSRFVWSPGRKHLAYVVQSKRADTVVVADHLIWPRPPLPTRCRRTIVGDLVWSPDGTGLAFREMIGKTNKLVVLLVLDNPDGDLVWPVPADALTPENQLFWAENKVVIGTSALQPRFAASWKRLQ